MAPAGLRPLGQVREPECRGIFPKYDDPGYGGNSGTGKSYVNGGQQRRDNGEIKKNGQKGH